MLDLGDETVQCTPSHRFFTGIWVAAGHLTPGQRLLCRDGQWRELQSVVRRSEPQPVFNLEVEGVHTYLVGRSGVVVHNEKEEPVVEKQSTPNVRQKGTRRREPLAPKVQRKR
jgi:hypothetical protein